MTIERLHSGFLAAPDVKVTRVDGRTSELVGGYAGWLMDDTILIGGGGYWLASGSRDREMGYGGLVVQWIANSKSRVGYGLKGLVGGGEARLTDTVLLYVPRPFDVDVRNVTAGRVDPAQLIRNVTLIPRTTDVRVREGFFVAEPEANVFARLTDHLRLAGGVGYRFIGSEDRDGRRLRGATGTVSLQIF
jgi:hypothetical protein